jgi:hypothetical protein
VFTFIVFVGDGWLALVPAHLPHLRLLDLERCDNVSYKYMEELMAALPEMEFIDSSGNVVRPVKNKI